MEQNQSPEIGKLCAALAKAFGEIEGATKDKVNPHLKNKYADLASVMLAVKPALVNNKLFFIQKLYETTGGSTVETIIVHESGEFLSGGKFFVPCERPGPHGTAAATTYARRISLSSVLGVMQEDDDGNGATKAYSPTPPPTRNSVSMQDIETLVADAKTLGELSEHYKSFQLWLKTDPEKLEKAKQLCSAKKQNLQQKLNAAV